MPYRHTTLRKTVGNKLKLLLMLQLLGYESTASASSMSAINNLILGAYSLRPNLITPVRFKKSPK